MIGNGNCDAYDAARNVAAAIKHVAENTPIVGEGANVYGYSDVMAYTVISVNKAGTVAVIQRDKATLQNGCDAASGRGSQRYSYERDPNGETHRITLRTKGKFAGTWRTRGQTTGAMRVLFGERREHYDFNF